MLDPLVAFGFREPKPVKAAAPESGSGDLPDYLAFDAKDHCKRLQIRRANESTHSPAYHYLLDIIYDGEFGTEIVLIYTFKAVSIKGKNLQNVIIALENNDCAFIQEFDPSKFAKPKPDEAIIESIAITVKE